MQARPDGRVARTCPGTSGSRTSRSLLAQGFDEADLDAGGSDRLVDAIVAWGDEEVLRARVAEHLAAGASHVSVQAVAEDPLATGIDAYRRVAPALLDL